MSPPACETPFEHQEFKAKRAKARHRNLHQKKADYLQSKHLPPCANACRNEQPHRSARTMPRTSLSKGAVEVGTDVSSIVMGGVEKTATACSRKAKVSPPLSCKRKGSMVAVGRHLNLHDGDDSFASVNSRSPSLVTFGDILASQAMEGSEVNVKNEHLLAVIDNSAHEFEKLCMVYEDLRGGRNDDANSIVSLMCSHPKSWRLQEMGFRALELLAAGKGYKHLVDDGSLRVLISAMRDHSTSEILQKLGCQLLKCIVACSADCRKSVAVAGGVEVVLKALAAHESSAEVQEAACRALKELAREKDDIQEEIASHSGFEVVLKAMDLQLMNADIQILACGVLRNMSAGNERHQNRIVSLGGVRKVCAAMLEHSQCEAVQWAGSWTIFCVALKNPASKAEILSHGCISLVLQAMTVHLHVQRVQVAGLWALKELASEIDGDSVRCDCIQMVSTALSAHCDDESNKVGRFVLRKLLERTGKSFSERISRQNKSMVESGHHLIAKKRRFSDLPTIRE